MIDFKESNWRIQGSSGGSVTVGTPTLKVQVGGGYIRLPVREKGTKKDVMLQGPGAGISLGIALETPWTDWINVSGSTDFHPSTGILPIYRKKKDKDAAYNIRNLKGDFLVFTAGANSNFFGLTACMGVWLTNHVEQCFKNFQKCNIRAVATSTGLKIVPGGFPLAILHDAHAVGFFWGLINTTDVLSAGGSVFQYRLM